MLAIIGECPTHPLSTSPTETLHLPIHDTCLIVQRLSQTQVLLLQLRNRIDRTFCILSYRSFYHNERVFQAFGQQAYNNH